MLSKQSYRGISRPALNTDKAGNEYLLSLFNVGNKHYNEVIVKEWSRPCALRKQKSSCFHKIEVPYIFITFIDNVIQFNLRYFEILPIICIEEVK